MALKCPKCGGEVVPATAETSKCKKCGTTFRRKSANAQNGNSSAEAKPKKKGGCLKPILIVVIAIGILGALFGNGGEKEESKPNNDVVENTQPQEENEVEQDVQEVQEVEEESPNQSDEQEGNNLTVGSSFEKGGLKITVNDSSLDFTGYSDEYGMYKPADGMKYIMVSFTFENNGSSDAYVSIYDFKCYADNAACEQAYLPDDSNFINTNLSTGRNISFQTYYSVPINASSIELEYETSIWTGEKAVIKLQ